MNKNIVQYNIYAFNCLSWSFAAAVGVGVAVVPGNRVLFWLFRYNFLLSSFACVLYFADMRNKIIPLAGAFYKNFAQDKNVQ